MSQSISEIKRNIFSENPVENLQNLASAYKSEIVFTTSFGYEDQVITHMIFANNLPIEVVTLDTGRLFKETYKVLAKHSTSIKRRLSIFPKHDAVEKMVSAKGPFSFYESVENRKECCNIRKVEPLNRALAGKKCWVTGIRADQSENRHDMDFF
jgi:phosphoadenosine phosphosulfate reductase